jgi:peptidoglycan hydrolase-like protein with peptidoglycan-binding domain
MVLLLKMRRVFAVATAVLTIVAMLGVTGHTALADDSLRPGDKGSAVEELQKLLMKVNCFDYGEVTGYYGDATETGVRKFQSTHGLTADGIAGSDTMEKLRAAAKSDKPLKPDSIGLGMSGTEVEDIQQRLKVLGLFNEPITGYFGPKTEEAVMAFQEAAGIKPDGIVGAKTKKSLFSSFSSSSLIPGMKGDNVKKLQQRLKDLGYYTADVTGLYGQLTETAVAYFQRLNGLGEDGIAGKKTQAAINDKNARKEKDARRAPAAQKTKYKDLPGQSAQGQETCAALVAYAKKYLGCPYIRGAEGPKSFDCSGLTLYVYKHFGVSLPRTAYAQGYTNYGIKITDKSKLMPGDLMFFDEFRDGDLSDHAAIYVGDGNFIQAQRAGTNVKITKLSQLNPREFSWGRRVFR